MPILYNVKTRCRKANQVIQRDAADQGLEAARLCWSYGHRDRFLLRVPLPVHYRSEQKLCHYWACTAHTASELYQRRIITNL